MFTWQRRHPNGYECSSVGDTRFSAFSAQMPDGRSIEHWYQCDIKAYDPGGTNWKLGKSKAPLLDYSGHDLWNMYLCLWRLWSIRNSNTILDLHTILTTEGKTVLTDCFANTDINQARALAQILNEWL